MSTKRCTSTLSHYSKLTLTTKVFLQVSLCIKFTNQCSCFTLWSDWICNRCSNTTTPDSFFNDFTTCHETRFHFRVIENIINIRICLTIFILLTKIFMC